MTTPYAAEESARDSRCRTRRIISLCIVLFTFCLIIITVSCGTKSDPADHALTQDERYLIDTYIKIIRARDMYSQNPFRAESLFTAINTTTDTLRIANTITGINAAPERWLVIFEVLDTRLQRVSKDSLE